MTTISLKIALASAIMGLSSITAAHTGDHAGVSIFHFMTNSDHALIFALAGLACIGALRWHAHRSRNPEKK